MRSFLEIGKMKKAVMFVCVILAFGGSALADVVVPDVILMSEPNADFTITTFGLIVGDTTYEYNNTAAAGLVLNQNPVGGAIVPGGSSVDLEVSLGKPIIPDMVGHTEAAAIATIAAVDNLVVGTVEYIYSDSISAGTVISHQPIAGTSVNMGTSVDLTVSLGEAPDNYGLVAHWKFDEANGITAYDSVGDNDGTLVNGPNWTSGVLDGALDFDGVDDYVDLGNDNSLKPPLPVTISGWIKLSAMSANQWIVAIDDRTDYYYGIWFYVTDYDKLAIGYGDGGVKDSGHRRSKVGTTELSLDIWYHVSAVIKGPVDIDI